MKKHTSKFLRAIIAGCMLCTAVSAQADWTDDVAHAVRHFFFRIADGAGKQVGSRVGNDMYQWIKEHKKLTAAATGAVVLTALYIRWERSQRGH